MKRRDLLVGGAAATAIGAAATARWWSDGDGDGGADDRTDATDATDATADTRPPSTGPTPPAPPTRQRGPSSRQPNILMVVIDDMKPWIGPHGFTAAHTPALDELSEQGVVFRRAYCAAPACSPSRAAAFTGRAPHQTGVYLNKHSWRDLAPKTTTFPRLLREAGYRTAGFGKLFHIISHDDPKAWDERQHHKLMRMPGAPLNGLRDIWRKAGSRFDWAPVDIPVEDMDDHRQVDRAIAAMKQTGERPWFVACGLFRPHLPWYVPRQFYDLYPIGDVPLPEVIADDLKDVPPRGRRFCKQEEHRVIVSRGLWRPAVQAYLAAISYADYEVGRLLAATPPDTVIVLWSDHGWHLGPKNHWHKYALWEEASQCVFAMAGPGIAAGEQCMRTVSLNDLYPTVCDIAGLAPPHALFGRSVVDLAADPRAAWDRPALTTYGPNNHSIRSERYRYIRYDDDSEELYDHDVDPHEWVNLARSADAASIIEAHAALLPARVPGKRRPPRNKRERKGTGKRKRRRTWLELSDQRRVLMPV